MTVFGAMLLNVFDGLVFWRTHHIITSCLGGYLFGRSLQVGGGKPKMRYYFGENGWPSSKLGAPPGSDTEKDALVDALQVRKMAVMLLN